MTPKSPGGGQGREAYFLLTKKIPDKHGADQKRTPLKTLDFDPFLMIFDFFSKK